MMKIALLDDYQNVAKQLADWSKLPSTTELIVFNDHLDDEDALVERLAPFEIICAMRERTPFPRSLLVRLPALELLITAGQKNASIDVKAANAQGVTVCGTTAPGHATGELTWGLILSLMRHLPTEDHIMHDGGPWQPMLGEDLCGKTLGVIGLGRLGSKVARIGLAFEMNVLAWSENLTAERAAEVGVQLADKDTLLSQSDVVTIHLRLSKRSRDLINIRELELMKPSAYLINTSRGPIINQIALINALNNKMIAGAGLDVYDIEPLSDDHSLRTLKNAVLTPHVGFVTKETYQVFYGEMLEDILAYLQGEPIRIIKP